VGDTCALEFRDFLNERCEADVLVPEEREREKVSLHMRDSTLAAVIDAAGLTIPQQRVGLLGAYASPSASSDLE
jgi:hypothetical protein